MKTTTNSGLISVLEKGATQTISAANQQIEFVFDFFSVLIAKRKLAFFIKELKFLLMLILPVGAVFMKISIKNA